MNNAYELMVILKTSVTEEQKKSVSDDVSKTVKPGKVKETKVLGKKTLAYPIKKEKEGIYLLFDIDMASLQAKELLAKLKLNIIILRYILIRKDSM